MAQPRDTHVQFDSRESRLTKEQRTRMAREHRETVIRTTNEAMTALPLSRRSGIALEKLNVLCSKIGAPIVQIAELKNNFAQMLIKDFAKMMKDDTLENKSFEESYREYYNKNLSALLTAGAKAQNDERFRSLSEDAQQKSLPRAKELTDAFETFMREFLNDMRARGIRRTNDVIEYGGNDEKGLFDIQAAAHGMLIKDNAQLAYEHCSRRGAATVAETCEAARRAVDNAFFYAHAFPQPSAQGVDANAPGMREAGIRESANVIRGLQEAHAARSLGWMFLHPIDYLREASTIRALKYTMSVRGGLTAREVEQKLSAPKETYADVSKNYDEIYDDYADRKLANAEREMAEDRRERERQRQVESAVAHSKERMREAGMSPDAVHARGRAEVEADMDLLNALEEIDNQSRSRSEESEPQSEEEKEPILINEEEPSEEKSEPVQENAEISAPQKQP